MEIISTTTTLNVPVPPSYVATTTVDMAVPAGKKLITAGWEKSGSGGAVFLTASKPVDVETWHWAFEYQSPTAVDVVTYILIEDV